VYERPVIEAQKLFSSFHLIIFTIKVIWGTCRPLFTCCWTEHRPLLRQLCNRILPA